METTKVMEPPKGDRAKSISQALATLNEAAMDSSEEIRRMASKDFRRVKETFADFKPELSEALRNIRNASGESMAHFKDQVVDSAKETAKKVDGTVHESPWIFAGTVAAVAGVAGFMLGRKSSH